METIELYQSYFILLPDKNEEPLLKDIRCRLNRKLNFDVKASMILEKEDHVPYSELVLRINCDFGSRDLKTIVRRCCESNLFEGIGESRLILEKALTINEIRTRNKNINVKSFSFGSLVGMNTFVEHYNTSWSENSGNKRITQLKADFIHDMSKMALRFVVADKREKDKDGENHRLHCMEIFYNTIQAIVVEEKLCDKKLTLPKYNLYLQIYSAPILKKTDLTKDVRNKQGNGNSPKKNSGAKDVESFYDKKNAKEIGESDGTFHEDYYEYISSSNKTVDEVFQVNLMRCVCFGGDSDNDSSRVAELPVIKDNVPTNPSTSKAKKGSKKFPEKRSETKENVAYCSPKTLGMCRTIKFEIIGEKTFDEIKQLVSCCGNQIKVYFAPVKVIELKKIPPNPSVPAIRFDSYYALKCVLSASYNVPDELYLRSELSEVNKILKSMSEENSKALEKSLYDINSCLEKGCVLKFKRALEILFNKYTKKQQSSQIKANITNKMVEMRRAILTPTRFIFLPPVPQLKSSLLEKCDTDHAMRVTVRDDNFDQMTFTLCGRKERKIEFLKLYVGDKLAAGFKIGDRNYEFLGSSTSQLREHGSFFYAKDGEGKTADDLRKSVGDVDQIDNVPKYMARMGQSLSQGMVRVNLKKEYVEGPIKDTTIMSPDGKEYNFTDGIGKISPKVAQMVYEALDLDPDDKPSAFQIRYGGCKGMLVVDPTLEPETKVIFRKSQWKFNSDQESLEILKVSKPQRAYLNRPFVTILDQMGVKEEHILELQANSLNSLIGSLVDSSDAMKMLKERATLRVPYSRLHYCGFDLSSEPFFKPMVMFLYRQAIGEMKRKARIQIPFDLSRTMFGVVDETDTLEYGQVFFQYSDITVEGKTSRTAKVYTGTVLVTKNPCMHPGDVRKFEAIDVEGLHHIKDCLVFPSKGPRPHPDEMAGSDLDGDEYVVIWDESLFFEMDNFEAMDYSSDVQPVVNNNIKVKDMTNFMCQYIMDDCVGLIASAHLALADSESIFGDRLIRIAKKYSVTLDFAKSGKPETLDYKEKPIMYPDFMEKFETKRTYLSTKCLGKLFRNCKRIEMISNILDDEVEIVLDDDLIYPGWEEYRDDAEKMLAEYVHLLMSPAKMFNVTKEGEIMSGAIKKIEKSFQGKNAKDNIDLVLSCVIPNVFRKCKQKFMEEFLPKVETLPEPKGGSETKSLKDKANGIISQYFNEASNPNTNKQSFKIESNAVLNEMLKKISAWYVVSYRAKINDSSACLGLPWTMPELMGLLKAQSSLRKGRGKPIPVAEQRVKSFINNLNLTNENDLDENMVNYVEENFESHPAFIVKKIIKLWLDHYDKFLSMRGLKSEKTYVRNFLNLKIKDYIEENPKSDSANLIIRFLRDLSSHCYSVKGSQNGRDSELGMLALISISNLTTTGKLWFTTETEKQAQLVRMGNLTKDFREQIVFPLDLGKDGSKDNFKKFILRYENTVSDTLKGMSRVKNIDIDFRETVDHYKKKTNYVVVLTVYGKLWAIESLKDFVIQPNFAGILMQNTKEELSFYKHHDDEDIQ